MEIGEKYFLSSDSMSLEQVIVVTDYNKVDVHILIVEGDSTHTAVDFNEVFCMPKSIFYDNYTRCDGALTEKKVYKYEVTPYNGVTEEVLSCSLSSRLSNETVLVRQGGKLYEVNMIDSDEFASKEGNNLSFVLYYTEPKSDEYISKILNKNLSDKLHNERLRHKLISSQLRGLIKSTNEHKEDWLWVR